MIRIKNLFAGILDSGIGISTLSNQRKSHLRTALATSILFTMLISILIVLVVHLQISSQESTSMKAAQALVKSSCSCTIYPEFCYPIIAIHPDLTKKVKNHKNVIEILIDITITAIQENYFHINKLIATRKAKNLTKRDIMALHDCLEMVSDTLDELHQVINDLQEYNNKYPTKKSLKQKSDDLKTLMSSTITDQETCLDGFSDDSKIRKVIENNVEMVEKMCCNALAMICNMTNADLANDMKMKRRKLSEVWPEWLSVGDRRLLQSGTVTADTVVAADGSGNHKTVAAAVAAAPSKSSERYVIWIKAGVYQENVEVPKSKINIMFVGDGRNNTIITGSRSVKGGYSTLHTATVVVEGNGFLARDITFENTAGPSNHQAVAIRVSADLSAFYRCDMLGYQDTLYVHRKRQFYVNCLIVGTVDFIFGNAAVVLQDCDIHARRPNSGQRNMITAQGRCELNQNTAIVIQKCRIGATPDLEPVQGSFPTYLGRPWKRYSRTVVMQSTIADVVDPAGWHEWDGNFALDTLYYGEYGNMGPGAGTSGRVNWTGVKLIRNASEAQPFTPRNFIGGDYWLDSTGFPFDIDL